MTTNDIRLCVPTPTLDAEVLRLYKDAFPAAERESVERLSELLTQGKQLCHRSLNDKGELLCFTIVTLGEKFSFLAYMATDPARRSGGIGSKHLERLLEIFKQTYPDHVGMFFEIETTHPRVETIKDEDMVNRLRRRKFYERAGARVICPEGIYLTPHYNDRAKEWEGELMGFEYEGPICPHELVHVLEQIYMLCYQMPATHPMVAKVFEYFRPCLEAEDTDCKDGDTQLPEDEKEPNSSGSENESQPEEENMGENEESNCGCNARGEAIRAFFSRIWAKIRRFLGLDA